jgi:ribosome-associated protein
MTSLQTAKLMAYAANNKKAIDPLILDLKNHSDIADFFVIVSGQTDIQVQSIYTELDRVCTEEKIQVLHAEGQESRTWILMDLGDVMVHIFRQEEREYYQLETIWKDCKIVKLPKL